MTSPFNVSDSSRTLDAYFHFWDKECLAQIFSRNVIPSKGKSNTMYQITDSSLLKKWFHKDVSIGKIYNYEDMVSENELKVISDTSTIKLGYKIGAKHSPLIEILRGILWREKYWKNARLIQWLDNYHPDCIVYNFSNHLFTQQIALFIANRYNIPIISIIGDDYYFNDRFSLNPFYLYFRYRFKKLTERILFRQGSSAVYCNHKIRDKYNAFFHMNGRTVYFNSALERRSFKPIDKKNPRIVYFGGIRLGRNKALAEIANALGNIDSSYRLEVYTSECDASIYNVLKENPYVRYGGFIPYNLVRDKIKTSDIFIIAESFDEKDINFTRYSLSTKASDALASGVSIFSYGPVESGVIEYMKSTNASVVCTNQEKLSNDLLKLIEDVELQKRLYRQAVIITEKNHSVENTTKIFEQIVYDVTQ